MKRILKQVYQNSRFNNPETIKLIFDSFSKNGYIRREVADNPSAPVYILEFLSKDKDENVRYYVARNPNYKKYIRATEAYLKPF